MRGQRQLRGAAAVEFALVITLLVGILFGVTELGRAFYQYNSLLKAARAAAREWSLGGPAGSATNRAQRAKCIAVYGVPGDQPCDTGPAPQPVIPGLSLGMVGLTSDPTAPYPYGCATISGFDFVSIVPWFDVTFAPITACMRQKAS